MRRNGACAAIASIAASNVVSTAKARPRNSTAPSHSVCLVSRSNRSAITASIGRQKSEFQSAGGASDGAEVPMVRASMIQLWRRPWQTPSAMPRDKAPSAPSSPRCPTAVWRWWRSALQTTLGKLAGLIDHPETGAEFALDLQGSPFELKVWQALREIPAGTTATYGEIAARIGSPREARDVGEACAANKLAVVVPCHRIVKKDGSISGYRWGVKRKRALLEREHRARLLRPSEAVPHGAAST